MVKGTKNQGSGTRADAARAELWLSYDAPMLVYVQRPSEKPFSLNAQMNKLSAGEIFFRCRARLKRNEIVGAIFKIENKDLMVNIRITYSKKIPNTAQADYKGILVGLGKEQEHTIRKYVLFENLKLNRKKRNQRRAAHTDS